MRINVRLTRMRILSIEVYRAKRRRSPVFRAAQLRFSPQRLIRLLDVAMENRGVRNAGKGSPSEGPGAHAQSTGAALSFGRSDCMNS